MLTKKLTTPFVDNSLSPTIKWYEDSKFRLIFKGSCLKQKIQLMHLVIEQIFFIVHELDTWSWDLNFPLKDCLFRGVKLDKNADSDKYLYGGYGIGFDSCSKFPW